MEIGICHVKNVGANNEVFAQSLLNSLWSILIIKWWIQLPERNFLLFTFHLTSPFLLTFTKMKICKTLNIYQKLYVPGIWFWRTGGTSVILLYYGIISQGWIILLWNEMPCNDIRKIVGLVFISLVHLLIPFPCVTILHTYVFSYFDDEVTR